MHRYTQATQLERATALTQTQTHTLAVHCRLKGATRRQPRRADTHRRVAVFLQARGSFSLRVACLTGRRRPTLPVTTTTTGSAPALAAPPPSCPVPPLVRKQGPSPPFSAAIAPRRRRIREATNKDGPVPPRSGRTALSDSQRPFAEIQTCSDGAPAAARARASVRHRPTAPHRPCGCLGPLGGARSCRLAVLCKCVLACVCCMRQVSV